MAEGTTTTMLMAEGTLSLQSYSWLRGTTILTGEGTTILIDIGTAILMAENTLRL